MNLTQESEKFFTSLEDKDTTMRLMLGRMPYHVLSAIEDQAKLIRKVKISCNESDEKIVATAMIIGYLLKGHLDRCELEENLKISTFD